MRQLNYMSKYILMKKDNKLMNMRKKTEKPEPK